MRKKRGNRAKNSTIENIFHLSMTLVYPLSHRYNSKKDSVQAGMINSLYESIFLSFPQSRKLSGAGNLSLEIRRYP